MVTYEQAKKSAGRAAGETGVELIKNLESGNALQTRNEFLNNVQYNGRDSHQDIINVLTYMTHYL